MSNLYLVYRYVNGFKRGVSIVREKHWAYAIKNEIEEANDIRCYIQEFKPSETANIMSDYFGYV